MQRSAQHFWVSRMWLRLFVALLAIGVMVAGGLFIGHTSLARAAAPASYYVSSSSGNDTWDGLTPAWDGTHGPWRTLTRASQPAYQAGDQILLKSRDYWTDGLTINGYGAPTNPILISTYGGGSWATINRGDSTMSSNLVGVTLPTAWGIKVTNLQIENARFGIDAFVGKFGQQYLWFENLYIHGCTGPFPGSGHDTYYYHTLEAGIQLDLEKSAVESATAASPPLLSGLTVTNSLFDGNLVGVQAYLGNALSDGTRLYLLRDVTVTHNLFENAGSLGFWFGGENGTFSNNMVIHNGTNYGFAGVANAGFYLAKNWMITNNEFADAPKPPSTPDGENVDLEGYSDTVTFQNNLFHNAGGSGLMTYDDCCGWYPGNGANHHVIITGNTFYHDAESDASKPEINNTGPNASDGAITYNRIYTENGIAAYNNRGSGYFTNAGNEIGTIEAEARGSNLAYLATANASVNASSAHYVNDGNTSTTWSGTSAAGDTLQLTWTKAITLNEFFVNQAVGSAIAGYHLQYLDDTTQQWVNMYTSVEPMATLQFMPVLAITTASVRLVVDATTTGVPAIAEFEAYAVSGPPTPGHTYVLTNVNSGMVANVRGASTANGAIVQQFPYVPGAMNEEWAAFVADTGTITLVNVNSGRCLDVVGASQSDNAPIDQWLCTGQPNQVWSLQDSTAGWLVVSANSGECLNVPGASKQDSQALQQYPCSAATNSQWRFAAIN